MGSSPLRLPTDNATWQDHHRIDKVTRICVLAGHLPPLQRPPVALVLPVRQRQLQN